MYQESKPCNDKDNGDENIPEIRMECMNRFGKHEDTCK